MRKDELRKLRALPATKEMMQKGKRDYDVLLRVQNLAGYIKIAVFLPEKMRADIQTPLYEIFLNVQGEEYITRELDDDGKEIRWLSAMVGNLPGIERYGYAYRNTECNVFLSNDARKTIKSLPISGGDNSKRGPINHLFRWQQEQHDKQMQRREQKLLAPWDADMKLVPELPPSFKEWMRKEVTPETYIIYEYAAKGQKVGYCSRCKKHVPIQKPKHNQKTKCPACKAAAVFKAHTRLQTLGTSNYDAEIIQKIKGGIVIRSFEQHQWYRDCKYTEPHIRTSEYRRILVFDNGIIKCYDYGLYKQKYHRWILDKSHVAGGRSYYSWGYKPKLYKKNFAQLKKNSLLRRSAIELWPKLPRPVTEYIEIEKGNPAVEMLARLGMFRLAEDIIEERYDKDLFAEDETEITKLLKIDKSRLKRLKDMDASIDSLRWMQYEKQSNTVWPDEMIREFGEASFKTSEFDFLNPQISFVKCHNYLKKQAAIMGETMEQVMTTWEDYLDMAAKLKMDTKCDQIQRPKDLKVAHDECVLILESKGLEKTAKEIEKKWPKVNEQLPKLQKYEFALGEYMIVAPKTVLDIVREGTILKHCVHTCDYYFSRIQTDESYLFFLRRSKHPDMPWYTLEVEPSGNIRQKRTTGDNQNADFQKAVMFLKKWQQHFKKQLTAEEEALGEKANALREENYKNLRKNGNRVWHGKLAGQLLADVLEQDFMAVGQ